jgi:hypothetical protein
MTTVTVKQRQELDWLQWRALAAGIIALVICAIAAPFSPAQFFQAYLTAYLFYVGIALGCLATLMLYHLTGGAWGFLIRRILEAGMRTLPLLAVLFIPIACGLGHLYRWALPEIVAQDKELQHKVAYLVPWFFWVRAGIYFVTWIALAYILSRWSHRQDQTGDARLTSRLGRLSGPGLVAYGITITFASVDWIMSLQPAFRSTIFGPLVATGQFLSGQAFAIIVLAWLIARTPVANLVSVEALNDLGNILFTFLIIWTYLGFFQYMLIWIANLQYDIIWYLPRSQGGWKWVGWALIIFHFAVPFFLLLLRDVKRDPLRLAMVAGLILFMQLVYNYFQVQPAVASRRIAQHWMDFLTPIGLGGIWLAAFVRQIKQAPILPVHDVSGVSAVQYRRHDEEEALTEGAHHG